MTRLEHFGDHAALANAAALILAEALAGGGPRSFVATGGTTPGPTYDHLARHDLDWARVTVTLSDERWVDRASPLSNEGLVRRRLLTNHAARATFLPLKNDGDSPGSDAAAAEPRLEAAAPFTAVLLGMGPDGHIASLFPGAPDLGAWLDPDGVRWCIGIDRPGLEPDVPRISLTARALLSSALVVMIITGAEKRALTERVLSDAAFNPPAATILRQEKVPVRVLWAP